jgi:hypothetical protein
LSGSTEEERKSNWKRYLSRFSADPVGFLESVLVQLGLGLGDCHRGNFCVVRKGDSFGVKIIDFNPPNERTRSIPSDARGFYEFFMSSPLMPCCTFGLRWLVNALNNVKAKLVALRGVRVRFAVSGASPESGFTLKTHLRDPGRIGEECSFSDLLTNPSVPQSITLSEFEWILKIGEGFVQICRLLSQTIQANPTNIT